MPTNTVLSSQESPISSPFVAAIRRAKNAVKTHSRFAKIAGLSFALTLPALGLVDPKVLVAAGRADAHTVTAAVARVEAALSNMAALELFATGGIAVLAMAGMAFAGYVRVRMKETRNHAEARAQMR